MTNAKGYSIRVPVLVIMMRHRVGHAARPGVAVTMCTVSFIHSAAMQNILSYVRLSSK